MPDGRKKKSQYKPTKTRSLVEDNYYTDPKWESQIKTILTNNLQSTKNGELPEGWKMGNTSFSKGKDSKGEYIAAYDPEYFGMSIGSLIGKNDEFYTRFYINDLKKELKSRDKTPVTNSLFDLFDEKNDKVNFSIDSINKIKKSDKFIPMTQGRLNTGRVNTALLDEVVKASKKKNSDPNDLLALLSRETTLGNAKDGRDDEDKGFIHLQKAVSGWNVNESNKPRTIADFLADKKIKGVETTKNRLGVSSQITDPFLVEDFLKKNPKVIEEYKQSLNKLPKINQNSLESAIDFIKNKGIGSYNPGDPDYTNKINKDKDLIKKEKQIQDYMMKNNNKKKYAYGGSTDPLSGYLAIQASRRGDDPTYIEDPNTALFENNIMKANAMQKVNSNPWTQGLDILGNLAIQYGTSMMNSGSSTQTPGGDSASTEGFGGFMNNLFGNSKQMKAFGGKVKGSQVEVEGKEVGELPNGQLLEFKGPSHEAGGIDAILPGGTDIFSKRISIDGISMADRKKRREKQADKIKKNLDKNSTDVILKNTSKRVQEINEMEDAFDMNIQEMFTPKNNQKFAGGGTVGVDPGNPNISQWLQSLVGMDLNDNQGFVDYIPQNSDTYNFNASDLSAGKDMTGYNTSDEIADMGTSPSSKNSFFDNILGNINSSSMPTVGDTLGIYGNLKQAYDPMNLTLENRAGDTPNINPFKDFGKDGLKTIQKSKGYIAGMRDKNIMDLNLAKSGAISRNRGTASGVNTQRALDLATDSQSNRSLNDIYSTFASQMMGILGQEAGMENQQDQMVMQGEAQRDLADRQDRDSFYTNLSRDKQAIGEALSRTGKSVNQIKGRSTNEKLLNQMSDYAEINIMNGNINAKEGVKLIGDTNRKLEIFEKAKGWEQLNIDKKEWDKLSKKDKLKKLV